MTIHLQSVAFATLATANGHHTYEQQAEATGLGIGTIHRLRNGSPASSASVAAICNAYGVEFADLFVIGTTAPTAAAA
ncbi:helix-turn-helix domain-containing protein [Streptomyces zaomyceticus]|uniref:helix-turn-helix domain-containing protein n=1 Tax=Streptomyces zaomyceticus TaxID=68286 RepID=UPI002E0EA2A4|nr:helix-turn-helix domain-containing protein [Streptomyces zaomyceticus]